MTTSKLIQRMPRGEYNFATGVNWSTLKTLARSPAHYRHNLLEQQKDSDARKLGRAVHLATLEPERFRAECAVWSGKVRAGKKWMAFKDENAGRELLTEKEADYCSAIQKAVRSDAVAARYLAGGKGEVSMFWTHKAEAIGGLDGYELECKGRVDFLADVPALVDLKTTRDASPEGFGRESWNYRYHAQAAYYRDGYEAITGFRLPYVLVAVESSAPYIVQVYTVPDILLEAGREEYRALLDRLNYCRNNAKWPGYADGETELSVPKWAGINEEEDLTGLGLDIPTEVQESA